jgi:hypothetical protein
MYLELIAPDPSQSPLYRERWMGLDRLTQPRLIGWAAKSADLERQAESARLARIPLGEVRSGRRERSNGEVLSWRFTYPGTLPGDGIVPFLIDWGAGPHPADAAAVGVRLLQLGAEHPEPDSIRRQLRILGIELGVAAGPRPVLIATLETSRGSIELR